MRTFILFSLTLTLLSSCSGGEPTTDVPEDSTFIKAAERTRAYQSNPYKIDSVCIFDRPKDGELVGEWMSVAYMSSIASELGCFYNIDMTGFRTRTENRWVIKGDGTMETHASDVRLMNFENDSITILKHSNLWTYEKLGLSDTIVRVDQNYKTLDTFRIVRLEADTLIIGWTGYNEKGWRCGSTLFYRRK